MTAVATEARLDPDARNLVRVGDVVRCREHPTREQIENDTTPWSFFARVVRIDTDGDGVATSVHVVGGRKWRPHPGRPAPGNAVAEFRVFRPDRVERTSQTRWEDDR